MYGGSTQAESPEWIPASSMCSMIAPRTHVVPSQIAVDVHLDRVLEELVDEDRAVGEASTAWLM